jgi:hypothetical protein
VNSGLTLVQKFEAKVQKRFGICKFWGAENEGKCKKGKKGAGYKKRRKA